MLPSKANMFYLDCQFRDIDFIKNDVDENNHEKPNQKWQAMVSGRVRQAMVSGLVWLAIVSGSVRLATVSGLVRQAMVSGRVREAMASGCVRQETKETSVNKNFIICFLYAVI